MRFAHNEGRRLGQLADRALDLDRQRTTPFVVEAMEQQHRVMLGGLQLSVKMDRVDRLEDGGRVLIDYKSGKVSRSGWEGARPAAPQLPLYATLLEQVAAVLYAQIRADEVVYKGAQQEESVMEGAAGTGGRSRPVTTVEEWDQQLAEWHREVTALAEEFRQGVATVTPSQGRNSCQYCGLQPLCRVEYE